MDTIEIWTDGSCLGNPGPGGWAALIRRPGLDDEVLQGNEMPSTNNRMELMAAIMVLEHVDPGQAIVLHADSQYVKDGITKWIHGWKRNGWRTAAKEPVKNAELWRRLDAAAARHRIEWRWVKGHANSIENNRVDVIARAQASEAVLAQEA